MEIDKYSRLLRIAEGLICCPALCIYYIAADTIIKARWPSGLRRCVKARINPTSTSRNTCFAFLRSVSSNLTRVKYFFPKFLGDSVNFFGFTLLRAALESDIKYLLI